MTTTPATSLLRPPAEVVEVQELDRALHRYVNEEAPFLFLYHQYQLFGLKPNFTWVERPVEFLYLNDLGWRAQ